MIPMTLTEVAGATGGRLDGDGTTVVRRVVIDSRVVDPGDLFVALRGEVHDGHDHVASAVASGAVAVLAERVEGDTPTVLVADTWQALARLGGEVRTRVGPRVVAVTGSVGKTTTKDFIAAAVRDQIPTVAAVGSFNNEAGVPLTMLELTEDSQLLVAEIGARGRGHIASLATHVRPDVAVVTAVAGVHLELFDDLDDVQAAKGELVEALGPDGVAVLNVDDPRVAAMASRSPGTVVRVSQTDTTADVHASVLSFDDRARAMVVATTPAGDVAMHLSVAGRHQVTNALLALAVAVTLGLDLQRAADGISTATVSAGRGAIRDHAGVVVLDDAYNANPTSMIGALDTLAAIDVVGRRIAVLGVMGEIGADHEAEHERVGAACNGVVDALAVVGSEAAGIARGARRAGVTDVTEVADAEAAAAWAADHIGPGDALLVKASRVAALEDVLARLFPKGPPT